MQRHDESFDQYRVVARIGSGGMADVFLAVRQGAEGFERLLVVKRLRANLSDDPRFRTMLLGEARLAARLHHPNIVQTFEVGENEGRPFIAMEYLDGQPLSALVKSQRQKPGLLDPAFAAILVSEALSGLHHAHELADYDGRPLSIVHRDVSPQNVFVTYAGEVKIVDFGIAKAQLADAENTDVGVLKGKLAYMAPEQALGEVVDRRADVFAMGVVLWELCAGRRLLAAETPVLTMGKLLQGGFDAPSRAGAATDAELDAICLRALERDRGVRFQTAAEMRDALEAWLDRTSRPGARRDLVARRVQDRFAEERKAAQKRVQAAMMSARERWSGDVAEATSAPFLRLASGSSEESELTRREIPGSGTPVPSQITAAAPAPSSTTPAPVTPSEPRVAASAAPQAGRARWLAAGAVGAAAIAASAFTVARWSRPTAATDASAAAPVASATEGGADLVLRLCGSNTVGAALAPALGEAFLRLEGATGVGHAVAPSGKGVLVSGTFASGATPLRLTVVSEGSATAFEGLASDTCDVGMSSRPIKADELTKLQAKGLGAMRSAASEHVIALDGIAVIVHPNNPTRALSRADVKRIFTGEVSEWSHAATREPGAPPGDRAVGSVNLYARDDASGTFDTFKHLVLGDRALATAKRFADSAALSDAVASDRVAIGFIGLAYVGNAKAIALSDVGTPATLPSAFTITTESYPLSRRLFFYTPAKPSHPAALRFVRFVLSDAGQKVVREAGFVDLGIELGGVEACTGKCPAGYLARTRGSRRLSVDFRFRDDTLDLDSRGVRDLDRLVAFLRDHSSGRLTLLGFSDDQGNPAATLAASRARANAVAAELTARGVRPAVVDGRGSEMPVAPNDDASGRERNRRVEVWLAER